MENITLSELVAAVKGEFLLGDPHSIVNAISINTRTLHKGDFFFAIKGGNFDGHDFLRAAIEKGCSGLVVSKKDIDIGNPFPAPPAIVLVKDTVAALGDIAAYYREKLKLSIVGITGSNGKTTTKEMLSSILRKNGSTMSNAGNFNNRIGLPLTIFNLNNSIKYAVLEMGTSIPGEIRRLASIASPDIGIITNIGSTHLENFGSLENIFSEKRYLIDNLPPGGTAVLNADDEFLSDLARSMKKRVITFGLRNKADVTARNLKLWPDKPRFDLVIEGKSFPSITIPVFGRFNVYNALAAAAAAVKLGIPVETIREGLENFLIPNMRMNVITLVSGVTLLVDAYNANPTSMKEALNSFVEAYPDREKIIVLGDMLELGKNSGPEHKKLGEFLNSLPLNRILLLGPEMKNTHSAVGGDKSSHFENKEGLVGALKPMLAPGMAVFFKASRGMHFEEIVDSILEEGERP